VEDLLKQNREPLGGAWEKPKPSPTSNSNNGNSMMVDPTDPEKTQTSTTDVDLESKPSNHVDSRVIVNPSIR